MWTHEELEALIPIIDQKLKIIEEDFKPLPPLTKEECLEYFTRFYNIANTRALALHETFLMGQLLSCFEHAIKAEMLGKKGRYIVMSEDEINERMKET